ncbi:MAG: hypothetical protein QXU32_00630 [Nitrososphaerales archaeon]
MPGFNIGGSTGPPIAPKKDLHRAHRWRIVTLGGFVTRDNLLYARTLTLPTFSVEEELVMGSSIKYKFAKAINWEDVRVSFYDIIGLYEDLVKWQDAVYTPTTGINVADSYKRDSIFELVDGMGNMAGLQHILKNSWPKSISHSELNYESSGIKLIELTLSYDWAERTSVGAVAT